VHELALAHAIVVALSEREGGWSRARLLIRGGHDAAEDFDAALRFHLSALEPEITEDCIEIFHLPVPRACASCGLTFVSAAPTASCPGCQGAALPIRGQQVEMEFVE
jgi:Zn finger protein HypA/HybF involved in hydrogenase expression